MKVDSNIIDLKAKNEALEAKNIALELEREVERMKQREKMVNHANWMKRANKPWKKQIVRSHLDAGYTEYEIANLYGVSEQTIKSHDPKDK